MKKALLAVVVLAAFMSTNTFAQGKIVLGVGGDVLLPMGTFGDAQKLGFGGSVRGQYNVTPMAAVGLTVGYYTWSGKDITIPVINQTVTGPKFSGLPVRVFGKYYFMPEGQSARFYGIAELGMFFGSVGDQTIPNPLAGFPGQPATITVTGGSSSNFNYAPGVGVEFGSGNTKIDVSARYDGIATSGSSSGSIGFRAGVNFPLGN